MCGGKFFNKLIKSVFNKSKDGSLNAVIDQNDFKFLKDNSCY